MRKGSGLLLTNECVLQCGTNKHSNESFDCVCNQFYNGSDCTSKYYK